MKKLILWITVLGMLSCTRNPGLVLGVGLGFMRRVIVLRRMPGGCLQRLMRFTRQGFDGASEGNDEGEQRCDGSEHHREELSVNGTTEGGGALVHPLHPPIAEPHLSVLSVGKAVC